MRSKRRDPLDVLLEYIATVSTADTCRVSLRDDVIYWTVQRAPSCDMALVHDDDLARILKVGEGTVSNAGYLGVLSLIPSCS